MQRKIAATACSVPKYPGTFKQAERSLDISATVVKVVWVIWRNESEELFEDIEKARQNQNSSGESKNKRSQSLNVHNSRFEKAITQFNESRLFIMNFCDVQLKEPEDDQERFLQDINEVFAH
jgi:hypothetical protein